MKSSSTKSYLSIVSFFVHWKSIFFLPLFEKIGVNSIYKYASPTRLKSKTFALQYLCQKSYLNCLQNLLFEILFLWVFVAIFGGCLWLLFDHKQLCIWPLKLSEHYEPGNDSKTQRLKPLRNSLNVSREKFDGRDFWTWWYLGFHLKDNGIFLRGCQFVGRVCPLKRAVILWLDQCWKDPFILESRSNSINVCLFNSEI